MSAEIIKPEEKRFFSRLAYEASSKLSWALLATGIWQTVLEDRPLPMRIGACMISGFFIFMNEDYYKDYFLRGAEKLKADPENATFGSLMKEAGREFFARPFDRAASTMAYWGSSVPVGYGFVRLVMTMADIANEIRPAEHLALAGFELACMGMFSWQLNRRIVKEASQHGLMFEESDHATK